MKKVLATFLVASLMSINLTCFAETVKPVSVTTAPSELNSKLLNKQYSAYSVSYTNKGQNPLLVNNIKGENLIGDMNKINEACSYSKFFKTMMALGPFTLGITTIIATPFMFKEIDNMKQASNEAVKYANASFIRAKNEVLMPQQAVTYFVLVPLNQTPNMTAVFEDTKTHEYTSVDTSK